jgi:hypothetical protein
MSNPKEKRTTGLLAEAIAWAQVTELGQGYPILSAFSPGRDGTRQSLASCVALFLAQAMAMHHLEVSLPG